MSSVTTQKTPSYAGLRPASEAASRAKRANRSEDTAHEVLLRKGLWRIGLRYRKHVAGLPGKPDLAFVSARVVVFCDGDFWHGRDWKRLRRHLSKRHNAAYWIAKIARNRQRDAENTKRLDEHGWLVIRLWETEVKQDPGAAAQKIKEVVQSRVSATYRGERQAPKCVGTGSLAVSYLRRDAGAGHAADALFRVIL